MTRPDDLKKADGPALKNLLSPLPAHQMEPYLETGQDLWTSTSISVSFEFVFFAPSKKKKKNLFQP